MMAEYSSGLRLLGSSSGISVDIDSKRSPTVRPTHTSLNLPPVNSLIPWHAAHTCRNLVSPRDASALNTPLIRYLTALRQSPPGIKNFG